MTFCCSNSSFFCNSFLARKKFFHRHNIKNAFAMWNFVFYFPVVNFLLGPAIPTMQRHCKKSKHLFV